MSWSLCVYVAVGVFCAMAQQRQWWSRGCESSVWARIDAGRAEVSTRFVLRGAVCEGLLAGGVPWLSKSAS